MKKQTQNKMRILSAVLALVMVLSTLVVLPMTANAETEAFHEVWDGSTKTAPKGEGTEEKPYLIANGENLAWLAEFAQKSENQNSTTERYYKQTADIDLGGHDFKSIGWQFTNSFATSLHNAAAFYGNYDGGNYTISNAKVVYYRSDKTTTPNAAGTGTTNVNTLGLFGAAHESTFKNIHLENIQVGTYNTAGADIDAVYNNGYAGILIGAARNTSIENCTIDEDCAVYAGWGAGGFAGAAMGNVTIKNCINKGTVVANTYAGGFIAMGNQLNISYSINDGKVCVDQRGHTWSNVAVGGFVAYTNTSAITPAYTETFTYCINGENAALQVISSGSDYVVFQGGILGFQADPGNRKVANPQSFLFSHCYNLATNTTSNPYPFFTEKPASGNDLVMQGAICGNTSNEEDGAVMEYCQSVEVKRFVATSYNPEGVYDGSTTASNTGINLDVDTTTNPLAGLVNARGNGAPDKASNAYDAKYWDDATMTTNKYGETAANIKVSADYQAIISATNYTPGVTVPETNGVVYRGHQRSSALTDETYDIRLVATVDSLNYEEVGFKFSISGTGIEVTDQQFSCTKVYSSLTGKDDGITKTYTAEALGGTYLMALALEGFTADMGQITITVTPYWIEAGETDATLGTSYQVVYNAAGELVTQKKA